MGENWRSWDPCTRDIAGSPLFHRPLYRIDRSVVSEKTGKMAQKKLLCLHHVTWCLRNWPVGLRNDHKDILIPFLGGGSLRARPFPRRLTSSSCEQRGRSPMADAMRGPEDEKGGCRKKIGKGYREGVAGSAVFGVWCVDHLRGPRPILFENSFSV